MDSENITIQIELKGLAQAVGGLKTLSRAVAQADKSAKHHSGAIANIGKQYQQVSRLIQQVSRAGGGIAGRISGRGGSGSGGGLLGLIGPALAAIGPEVAAVAAAAAASAAALIGLEVAAIGAGKAFARMGMTAGGTRGETGLLSVYGNALGTDLGQLSRQISAEISQGGPASGFAARLGLHDQGLWGSTDKAQLPLEMIKKFRAMSDREAFQTARAIPGAEALLPTRLWSDKTMGKLGGDAKLQSSLMSPEFLKNAENFSVAFGRITTAFQNLAVAVAGPMLPTFEKFFDDLADTINKEAEWWAQNANIAVAIGKTLAAIGYAMMGYAKMLVGVYETVIGGLGGNKKMAIHGIENLASSGEDYIKAFKSAGEAADAWSHPEKYNKTLDRHIDAMERHSTSMDYATRNGIYGGGERAQGFVPKKWLGMEAGRYVSEAARLGAFNL